MLRSERVYTSDMTGQQWENVRPLLSPEREGPGRPLELDLRQVINAIFYVSRAGCQWKNLPKDYPNHNSVYYYYGKWRDDGTWQRVNEACADRKESGRAGRVGFLLSIQFAPWKGSDRKLPSWLLPTE